MVIDVTRNLKRKEMKQTIKILAVALAVVPAFMFSGCIQGKYDTPEVSEVPVGDTVTIVYQYSIIEIECA